MAQGADANSTMQAVGRAAPEQPMRADEPQRGRLRVLHVLNELMPSGAETMLVLAGPHFTAAGVDCDILAKGRSRGPFAPQLQASGYGIHHLPLRTAALLGFAWRFVRLCRSNRYQAVHIHTEHANILMAMLTRYAGITVIVRTVHNVFPFDGWLRRRRIGERALMRLLGVRQVSIGPSVRANEAERFRNPTRSIGNWFDPQRIAPPSPEQRRAARAVLGIAPEDFVLISVGNCSRIKNHGAVIAAMAAIGTRIPLRYLHIGTESAEQDERAQAQSLGVTGVTFLGPQRELASYFHAADLYIMPSLHEGFSISALEGLAAGLPGVLCDVPGLRDLKPLVRGVVWCSPSAESLAQAIQDAYAQRVSHARPGAANRRRLSTMFSPARNVRRYIALYQRRLGAPSPVKQ